MNVFLIGLGGVLGALSRYYIGLAITQKVIGPFPLGTFVINSSGSFLLGLLVNMQIHGYIEEWVMLFIGVGFCGAFTTFSTFGNETIQLLLTKQTKTALIYVTTSVFVSIIAAVIGFYLPLGIL